MIDVLKFCCNDMVRIATANNWYDQGTHFVLRKSVIGIRSRMLHSKRIGLRIRVNFKTIRVYFDDDLVCFKKLLNQLFMLVLFIHIYQATIGQHSFVVAMQLLMLVFYQIEIKNVSQNKHQWLMFLANLTLIEGKSQFSPTAKLFEIFYHLG